MKRIRIQTKYDPFPQLLIFMDTSKKLPMIMDVDPMHAQNICNWRAVLDSMN